MTSRARVDASLALAERALALGDGLLCQSICLDVIEAAPDRAGEATSLLVQAVAASPSGQALDGVDAARRLAAVTAPGERAFLEGLLAYRRAQSLREEGVPDFVQQEWLQRALKQFEAALRDAPDHLQAQAHASLIRRMLAPSSA